jgi:hypothetical protein
MAISLPARYHRHRRHVLNLDAESPHLARDIVLYPIDYQGQQSQILDERKSQAVSDHKRPGLLPGISQSESMSMMQTTVKSFTTRSDCADF